MTANPQVQKSDNLQQKRHRNYYASDGGEVICEGYSVEEIHVDDEGDTFRVKYEKLGEVNRITVIDDEYNENNDGINNKVMEAHALCRQQEEKWVTRARQLDRKAEDIAAAQQNICKNRLKNKAYFDKNR